MTSERSCSKGPWDLLGEKTRILELSLLVLLTACDRTEEGAPHRPQASSNSRVESDASLPKKQKTEPDRPFEPVSYEELKRLAHDMSPSSNVQVDLHPYCDPQKQPPDRTSPTESEGFAGWRMEDQDHLRALAETSPSFVGLVLDEQRRTFVLAFEPGFTKWRSIQERIASSDRLAVELRPACHTSDQRERARSLLNEFKIARPPLVHGWTEEPSIGGFRVFVLPGDERAAEKVKEQLGSIANVWFSRPFGEH